MYIKPFFFRQDHTQHTFYNLSKRKVGELFVVRHAKSDHNVNGCCAGYYNHSKPTNDGMEDIRKVGKLFSNNNIKFDKLYVSPLYRALVTAQTLLNDLPPVNITTTEALTERNFGAFTGLSKKKIKEKLNSEDFSHYIHDKHFFPPNIGPGHKYYQSDALYGVWPDNHKGESYQCVINRLHPFLDNVKEELLNGKNILIIGHSHNLQILQMLLYESTFEQGIEKYKIEHAAPVTFKFSLSSNNKLIVKQKTHLIDYHTSSSGNCCVR